MSVRVKARLDRLLILATHEERQDIDREVELRTKMNCEQGIDKLSDNEVRQIVVQIRKQKRVPRKAVMEAIA